MPSATTSRKVTLNKIFNDRITWLMEDPFEPWHYDCLRRISDRILAGCHATRLGRMDSIHKYIQHYRPGEPK